MSYDPVSVLATFAKKHDITYPLLSDVGSQAIRRLGLLNEHIAEQHAHYGVQTHDYVTGVPYPGTFVLDERGTIVEKQFEQGYRVRPAAVSILESSFGQASPEATRTRIATEELQAVVWLGAPTYRPYQKLRLKLEVQVAPGLHIYGQPIPGGYTPLTVLIDPLETLEVGDLDLPKPHPFRVEGLEETFHIHEGTFHGALPLILLKNLGNVTLAARLRYQACSDTACYPPREVPFRLPLVGLDNVRD